MLRARVVAVGTLAAMIVSCAEPNRSSNTGAVWTVDATPLLDIGDGDADTLALLGDVEGATRLADGTVVVADRAAPSLTYFSPDGKVVRRVGRKGSGPGEFETMWGLLRCGDSLFVRDGMSYKVFSLDGESTRQFKLEGPGGSRAYTSACSASGVFVSYGWDLLRDLPPRSSVTRAMVPFWLSNADGSVRANLGPRWGSERWATVAQPISGTGPLPLGKQPVIAAGRSRVYIGTADSFAIDVLSLDGARLGLVRKVVEPVKVTPADIERFKLLDSMGKPREMIERDVRTWADVRYPQTLPAYTALVVDSDDNLWVRTYPSAASAVVRWIVFSAEGVELAALSLPHTLQVNEVGRDYILGTDTDVETGSERVKLLRLRRGPAR
jgi:hypothetical protein